MKLRSQSLWFVIIATGVIIAAVAGVSALVLLPAADRADAYSMELRLARLRSRLAQRIDQVRIYANEYGPWTDTVEFIQGNKPDFIEANLNAEQLANAHIEFVAVWDAAGHRLVALEADSEADEIRPASAELVAALEAWSGLAQHDVGSSATGVIATPRGPMLFAALPVTRDDRSPPSAGTFFAGKWIDQNLLAELTAGENHVAELHAYAPDHKHAHEGSYPTGPNSRVSIHVLTSPDDAPVGEVVLTAPRYGHEVLARSLIIICGVVALGAAGLAVIAWRLINLRLVRRIEALTLEVGRLENDAAARQRLALEAGNDELSQLARDTGAMAGKLADARLAAEAATRAKGDFLAAMSHEIRTPLNGVIGYIGLLRDTPLSVEQAGHVRVIEESGEALLGVINSILDYSKLESGRVTLESIPTDVAGIAGEVLTLFQPKLQLKGVAGSIRVADGVPLRLLADPLRVRQVLTNLVGNAVKFTLSGEIVVSLAPLSAAGDRREGMRIDVADTGIGLTPDQRSGLFKPFAQADSTITRRYGGTGLGLAICHQIVEAWGGAITVESQPGRGSTFSFTLPAPVVAAPAIVEEIPAADSITPASANAPHPLRILMAEDNEVNARLLLAILKRHGYVAEHVTDGRAALEAMSAREFDLVLMDVQMPEMDGLEATRRQRERERALGLRPLIIAALTANALAGARDECIAAGMDDYLAKPFHATQVKSLLERATARKSQAIG